MWLCKGAPIVLRVTGQVKKDVTLVVTTRVGADTYGENRANNEGARSDFASDGEGDHWCKAAGIFGISNPTEATLEVAFENKGLKGRSTYVSAKPNSKRVPAGETRRRLNTA
jgi:hypothetical protein